MRQSRTSRKPQPRITAMRSEHRAIEDQNESNAQGAST